MSSVHLDKKWFLPQLSTSFPSTYQTLKALKYSNWPKGKKTCSANEFVVVLRKLGAKDVDDAVSELGDEDNDEFGDYEDCPAAYFLLGLCGVGEFKKKREFKALSNALNPSTSTKHAKAGKATRTLAAGVDKLKDQYEKVKAAKKLKKGKKKKKKKKHKRLSADSADGIGHLPSSSSSSSEEEMSEEEGVLMLEIDDDMIQIGDDNDDAKISLKPSNLVVRTMVQRRRNSTNPDELITLSSMNTPLLSAFDEEEEKEEGENVDELIKPASSSPRRKKQLIQEKCLEPSKGINLESQISSIEEDSDMMIPSVADNTKISASSLTTSRVEKSGMIEKLKDTITTSSVDDGLSELKEDEMASLDDDSLLTDVAATTEVVVEVQKPSSLIKPSDISVKIELNDKGESMLLDDDEAEVDKVIPTRSISPRSRRESFVEVEAEKAKREIKFEEKETRLDPLLTNSSSELVPPSSSLPREEVVVERKFLVTAEDHESPKVCEESIDRLGFLKDVKIGMFF